MHSSSSSAGCGEEEKKGAHKLTVRDTGRAEIGWQALQCLEGSGLTFPDPHSCLGCRWQGGCQTEPRPLVDLIFMALQSGYTANSEEGQESVPAKTPVVLASPVTLTQAGSGSKPGTSLVVSG